MAPVPNAPASLGSLHHVELWVPDLPRAKAQWGWLLGRLGYEAYQDWAHGCSWRRGPTYIVVEQSPALSGAVHERTVPGLNHLAFNAGTREQVDAMAGGGPAPRLDRVVSGDIPARGRSRPLRRLPRESDGYEVELIAAD